MKIESLTDEFHELSRTRSLSDLFSSLTVSEGDLLNISANLPISSTVQKKNGEVAEEIYVRHAITGYLYNENNLILDSIVKHSLPQKPSSPSYILKALSNASENPLMARADVLMVKADTLGYIRNALSMETLAANLKKGIMGTLFDDRLTCIVHRGIPTNTLYMFHSGDFRIERKGDVSFEETQEFFAVKGEVSLKESWNKYSMSFTLQT